MKNMVNMSVTYEIESGHNKSENFYGPDALDKLFSFLVEQGFYDDIQAMKRFTTSKEVMKRLTK